MYSVSTPFLRIEHHSTNFQPKNTPFTLHNPSKLYTVQITQYIALWRKLLFGQRYGKSQEAHSPKRTGKTPWFFRTSAGTKLNCAFNNSGLNSKKNKIK